MKSLRSRSMVALALGLFVAEAAGPAAWAIGWELIGTGSVAVGIRGAAVGAGCTKGRAENSTSSAAPPVGAAGLRGS